MEKLCRQDNILCPSLDMDNPIARKQDSPGGEILQGSRNEDIIAAILSGRIAISYDKHLNRIIEAGSILLLQRNTHYSVTVLEDTQSLIMELGKKIEFCNRIPLEWYFDDEAPYEDGFVTLPIHDRVTEFLYGLDRYLSDGIKCRSFLSLKIREFMFLLRTYYSREELARFFRPVVSTDTQFSDFIFENYEKYKTVQQLASASCHSLSAFNKLFRKTFGESPYRWMQHQKAGKMFHDISVSNKTLKEVCDEYGFNSLSQFSNFCKAQFGMSPRKIRESSHSPKSADNINSNHKE